MRKFDPENFVIDKIVSVKVVPYINEEIKERDKNKKLPKRVTKIEFENFLENYPRKLQRDVCGIYEPPLVSYNDFELADKWPDSVVAFTYLYDDNPEGYYYCPENERTYTIAENYEELFKNRTGRQ